MMISTDRLRLESISEKYIDDIFREFTSEITRYMFPSPAKDRSETEDFVRESIRGYEKGEEVILAILDGTTGEFYGCAGLHKMNTQHPEFGIWLKKSAHGNRYGREAIHALKEWADKNLAYEYIVYPVDKENIASRKIPESLGGVVVAKKQESSQDGTPLDEVVYHVYPA